MLKTIEQLVAADLNLTQWGFSPTTYAATRKIKSI